jgi:hypothetical protein
MLASGLLVLVFLLKIRTKIPDAKKTRANSVVYGYLKSFAYRYYQRARAKWCWQVKLGTGFWSSPHRAGMQFSVEITKAFGNCACTAWIGVLPPNAHVD